MAPMQDKILKAIDDTAKEAGLECVVNFNCSNTGNIIFQKGFETVLSCVFDFQPSYASLQFYPSGVKPIMCIGFTHEKCGHSAYLKYENMSKQVEIMLDFIRSQGTSSSKPIYALMDAVAEAIREYDKTSDHVNHGPKSNCIRCRLEKIINNTFAGMPINS